MLNLPGTIIQFILAFLIFSIGGVKWSIPILFFFISSSILTRINKRNKNENSSFGIFTRNHWQVLANGGIAGLFVVIFFFTQNEFFYFCYLVSISVACSDTWSTEFGTGFKTSTYNILNLKPVPHGISGGVSVIGSFAGLCGAILTSLSGFVLTSFSLDMFLLISLSGLLGNILDSILGAALQKKQICSVCGIILEELQHCQTKTKYYSGIRWLNNDMVNFISCLFGTLIFITFHKLI